MPLTDDFQAAVAQSQQLTKRPDNEELLELYALFKQATDGDVTGERPGGFDFKGMAKFDAWAGKKGMSPDDAMGHYISLMAMLRQKYS